MGAFLEQVLSSVVMVLVSHLTSFEYGIQPASAQAGVARMLAALTVRLTDTVGEAGGRRH